MPCFHHKADKERKQLRFILGPLKLASEKEMKIYREAALFSHSIKESKDGAEENVEGESTACAKEKEAVFYTKQSQATNNHTNESNETLFTPLECTSKSLRVQQTFNMWKAPLDIGWKFRRMRKRRTIGLQPLDSFPEFVHTFSFRGKEIGFFSFLQDFTRIYFYGFNVEVYDAVDMEKANWNITSRIHPKTNEKQYLVKDIQKCLQRNIPRNSYCSVGISWTDLYPNENLNFVLGEAYSAQNSGVLSFGRFEPKAYKDGQVPSPIEKFDGELLWKMLKVLSHETCHIFGLAHCVYFECNMNESTSVPQAMSQPLYLCPVCLRKLQKVCKFDMEERYSLMLYFLQNVASEYPHCDSFINTIEWLKRCLDFLGDRQSTYL